jgi:hypothetical protein
MAVLRTQTPDTECRWWVEAWQPIQRTPCLEPDIQADDAGQLTFAGDDPGHQRSLATGSFLASHLAMLVS